MSRQLRFSAFFEADESFFSLAFSCRSRLLLLSLAFARRDFLRHFFTHFQILMPMPPYSTLFRPDAILSLAPALSGFRHRFRPTLRLAAATLTPAHGLFLLPVLLPAPFSNRPCRRPPAPDADVRRAMPLSPPAPPACWQVLFRFMARLLTSDY